MSEQRTHWIHRNQLIGHIAHWAVRLHPYWDPPGLRLVLKEFWGQEGAGFDEHGMREVTRQQLRTIVDTLMLHPVVREWNRPVSGHTDNVFVSRYDRPKPEDDFIDLDALCMNVVRSILQECAECERALEKVRPRFLQMLDRLRGKRREERAFPA